MTVAGVRIHSNLGHAVCGVDATVWRARVSAVANLRLRGYRQPHKVDAPHPPPPPLFRCVGAENVDFNPVIVFGLSVVHCCWVGHEDAA